MLVNSRKLSNKHNGGSQPCYPGRIVLCALWRATSNHSISIIAEKCPNIRGHHFGCSPPSFQKKNVQTFCGRIGMRQQGKEDVLHNKATNLIGQHQRLSCHLMPYLYPTRIRTTVYSYCTRNHLKDKGPTRDFRNSRRKDSFHCNDKFVQSLKAINLYRY